ncbi:MAG TPA: prepilin-type N-terminal cleavage/methylation domain-containing protein [Candidatus Andersenbacteria bacterium]|nr:prepilin-type N-terminal cleavage/methylation domain-containing protein [Candidatus Andersenbacteria bacterium]
MNDKGFTLIEVLIGLFIAVIASISVAQVIANTNKVVTAGRQTFIATNLAHEGLELTRQLRDDTWFQDNNRANWMSNSSRKLCPGNESYTYTIDPENFNQGDSNSSLYLHKVSVNGETYEEWTHTNSLGDTNSGYSRVMTVDCSQESANPAFVTITATVSWMGQSATKEVSIQELLYNWLP